MGQLTVRDGEGQPLAQATLLRVDGRVQRVGFRAFVAECARATGARGWVCNLPTGSVAVAAAGPPDAIATLRAALAHGPAGASVRAVVEVGSTAVDRSDRFRIVDEPPAEVARAFDERA